MVNAEIAIKCIVFKCWENHKAQTIPSNNGVTKGVLIQCGLKKIIINDLKLVFSKEFQVLAIT